MRRIEKRAASWSGGSLENPANWLTSLIGGQVTAAGMRVNERNALYLLDVMTCISKISSTIAQLPFPVYKRGNDGGKTRARNHPLYNVLQEEANSEMSAFTFKETVEAHVDSWGNGYAWIERNDDRDCIGLWPLLPDRTHPFRMNGELFYYTRIRRMPLPGEGEEKIFPARDVFHLAGLGFDGLVGYSVIDYMREAIGLAMAQDEYSARMFSNGATPPSVLTVQKRLSPEDITRIKASWGEQHQGVSKAWRMAVLEEGMDIKAIGIPPQDAQLLEGQKFSRARISGFFGVPPPLMGDTDRASSWGTGIEQLMIGYLQTAIQPRATRWEQAVGRRLFIRPRDTNYFAEFLLDGLQRGDFKSRQEGYALGFGKWLTADDIRERENMNPYKAPADPKSEPGKVLLWPLNMGSAEDVIDPPKPDPAALPAGDPKANTDSTAASRRALASAHRFSFADTADRIIRREQADVARALKRGKAAADAIATLYLDHEGYVKRQMLPVLRTYAAAIGAELGRELAKTVVVPDAFVDGYADGYAKRHVAASLAGARALVGDKDRDAVLATWSARTEWIATRETVQAGNAFAKAAYRVYGVSSLRWSAGDECPSCSALDGTDTPIDDVFIRRGAGGPDEFIPANGLGHPPLCDGCACVVVSADARTITAPAPIEPRSAEMELMKGALRIAAAAAARPDRTPATAPIVIANDISQVSELSKAIQETNARGLEERAKDREADEKERAMNNEQMETIFGKLADAQVRSAELIAGAVARRDSGETQPVQLVMPEGAIVVNVDPSIQIPPIVVNVEAAEPKDMEIVYDSQGRITGTRRT